MAYKETEKDMKDPHSNYNAGGEWVQYDCTRVNEIGRNPRRFLLHGRPEYFEKREVKDAGE